MAKSTGDWNAIGNRPGADEKTIPTTADGARVAQTLGLTRGGASGKSGLSTRLAETAPVGLAELCLDDKAVVILMAVMLGFFALKPWFDQRRVQAEASARETAVDSADPQC